MHYLTLTEKLIKLTIYNLKTLMSCIIIKESLKLIKQTSTKEIGKQMS